MVNIWSTTAHRFSTPDSIVPDGTNPQDYNRYAYVRNQPLNFVDPSGHYQANAENGACYEAYYDPCAPAHQEEYSAVLTFTLVHLRGVQNGELTDAEAMLAIVQYAIDDVANGNIALGLQYAAGVFWRDDFEQFGFPVASGFNYKDYTDLEFGVTGFGHDIFVGGSGNTNQVEHFIGEAYLTAAVTNSDPWASPVVGTLIAVAQEIRPLLDGGNPDFLADLSTGVVAANMVAQLGNSYSPAHRNLIYQTTLDVIGMNTHIPTAFQQLTTDLYRFVYRSPNN